MYFQNLCSTLILIHCPSLICTVSNSDLWDFHVLEEQKEWITTIANLRLDTEVAKWYYL